MSDPRRQQMTPHWRLQVRRWLETIVCFLAVLTLLSGLLGFGWQYYSPEPPSAESQTQTQAPAPETAAKDWSIPFFKTIQLFLLNSGAEDDPRHPSSWLLLVARLSAASLFLVVSSTAIVRVLDQVRKLPRHLTQKNHVVICGLGQIGLQILDDLYQQDRAGHTVIIEIDPASAWLDYARARGADVLIGDASRAEILNEARVQQAAEIFVVTGDDGVNLEITAEVGLLRSAVPGEPSPLNVYVHVADVNLATTLRPYCSSLHNATNLEIHVFSVPRTAAARLVTEQLWPYSPKQTTDVAHYVILGFGAMGQALTVQLAQLGHFPNRKRSRFTIADADISQSARSFVSRFSRFTTHTDKGPGVAAFLPEADDWTWNEHPLPEGLGVPHAEAIQYVCNAEFVELPAGRSDERFVRRLATLFAAPGIKPAIFVCGQQDRENFETAVHLRDTFDSLGHSEVPIFVWLPRQPALAHALAQRAQFIPFGECRSAASYEEITAPMREKIGQLIHRDYQIQSDKRSNGQSRDSWSAIRDAFRESSRVAADHLLIKLATLGLQLRANARPETPPRQLDSIRKPDLELLGEMEHNRWVAERLLAGWRFAPKRGTDEETQRHKQRKLNHNLVAWENLGEDRQKDFDQVKTVLRECQKNGFSVEEVPPV